MKKLLVGLASFWVSGLLAAQEAEPPVFPAGTEAVLLDMVVRDAEADDVQHRYRALVERYRAGSHDEAVSELRSWDPGHVSLAVGELLAAWREAPMETVQTARAIQAASLLHTDAIIAVFHDGRRDEHALHVSSVRRLLRAVHTWQRGEGQRSIEHTIPSRDLYLGVAAAQLGIGSILQANVLLVEYYAAELGWSVPLGNPRLDDVRLAEYSAETVGMAPPVQPHALIARHLRDVARDWEMLLLAGCAQEAMPIVYRQATPRWSDRNDPRGLNAYDALRRAELFLRHALDVAPESVDARLRLGWTLLKGGKPEKARALLEAAAADGDATQAYLAWLFLGRLHERDSDPEAAIAAFRRAIEVDPGGQAAQVGLARALERETNHRAACEVMVPFFVDQRPAVPKADPWVDYPFGPEELRLRPIDALRQGIRRP